MMPTSDLVVEVKSIMAEVLDIRDPLFAKWDHFQSRGLRKARYTTAFMAQSLELVHEDSHAGIITSPHLGECLCQKEAQVRGILLLMIAPLHQIPELRAHLEV